MADRPILVLKHDEDSPPGLLGKWLDARGLPWVMPAFDDVPDDPAGYAAVVSLGSVASANDDHRPWVVREHALVQQAIADDVPVLGLCFGSQMLARAAGGSVTRRDPGEFGWIWPAGEPGAPTDGPWFCWHDDIVTLPPGAELVASSPLCPQAFTLEPHVGFQFHPEVDEPTIAKWLVSRADPKFAPLDLAPTLAANASLLPELAERAFALFDWWIARVRVDPDIAVRL